ncbi:uncharacterized protein LOC126841160 [Adelges cooleyi]|uniref:uncharacterized protein LOC126841160 n=1 Tax=Adelges cooleyi TaxID=133065 RepID=UPI00217F6951|nr:uncharacterized protein LOC126841160 [Adelges cooleyi]XP_050433444.1 uncharacterized protein LOC126841160 [Adelges cooleyi]
MPWCAVVGCRNNLKATKRAGRNVSYHIFPKNPQRRNAWVQVIKRPTKFNVDSSYVCSEHFVPNDFECNSLKEELLNIKVKRQLKKTAVPSVNMTASIERLPSKSPDHEFPTEMENKTIKPENLDESDINKDTITLMMNVTKSDDGKNDDEKSKRLERKKIVDKLLADYEEEQKNESQSKCMVSGYTGTFSSNINSNAKLGDKLKLLKAKDLLETASSPVKKRKMSSLSKSHSETIELSTSNTVQNPKSINDQVIHVSAVKGGLMLQAISQLEPIVKQPKPNLNLSAATHHQIEKIPSELEEEIIIVTEDEANRVDLSLYTPQQKDNSAEVIIVTDLKDSDSTKCIDILPKPFVVPKNNSCITNGLQLKSKTGKDSVKLSAQQQTLLHQDKECQVLFPCTGCEHRSFKINKLLRERTKLVKDLNVSGTWKDPDEMDSLRKMNGVLSILLMQSVNEKNSRKSSAIRVDLVQDTIERVDRGWTMQDTSEVLSQIMSANAYDEFARTFEIVNEI